MSRPERPLICIVTVGEALSFAKRLNWGPAKKKALEFLLEIQGLDAATSQDVQALNDLITYARS